MKGVTGSPYVGEPLQIWDLLAGLAAKNIKISPSARPAAVRPPGRRADGGAAGPAAGPEGRDHRVSDHGHGGGGAAACRHSPAAARDTHSHLRRPRTIGAPFSFFALSKQLGDDQSF